MYFPQDQHCLRGGGDEIGSRTQKCNVPQDFGTIVTSNDTRLYPSRNNLPFLCHSGSLTFRFVEKVQTARGITTMEVSVVLAQLLGFIFLGNFTCGKLSRHYIEKNLIFFS